MDLNVLAIGRKMPDWVSAGWYEYQRRMPAHLPLNLIELDTPTGGSTVEVQVAEADLLTRRMPLPATMIALDSRGRSWTTGQLAGQLESWQMEGQAINFIIGGANGLAGAILDSVDQRWSLGPLTLPHMMVRVILAEQLYRAWTITVGHPYHRA